MDSLRFWIAPRVGLGHSTPHGRPVPLLDVKVRDSQAPQKIVQTQGEYGILLKIAQTRYLVLKFVPVFRLGVLAECTGESLQAHAALLSLTSPTARSFHASLRAATTDAASTCILAEQLLASRRRLSSQLMHLLCEVHNTSGVCNFTLMAPSLTPTSLA